MGFMGGRTAHRMAALGVLLLAGCGSSEPDPMPAACLDEPAAVARALERAPAAVTLADGTPLSRCVALARREGDLQALGVVLTQVADGLRARVEAEPAAALRLGYLVGAVRRGEPQTPGLTSQLARRIEQIAALEDGDPVPRAQIARGMALGEAGG